MARVGWLVGWLLLLLFFVVVVVVFFGGGVFPHNLFTSTFSGQTSGKQAKVILGLLLYTQT